MKSLQIFAILFLSITLVSAGFWDFLSQGEEEVLVNITYTSTTDTVCRGDVCTLTLWSGIRNVYEDNEWKKIEKAKSLKGYYDVIYLENDERYEIEIEDFNYTCLKKLKIKSEVAGNIPFKLNHVNYVSPYMKAGEEIELEDICMDNIFAYNFTLGESSTTIMLQDADTENLDDAYVRFGTPDGTAGTSTNTAGRHTAGSVGQARIFMKFNISSIPSGVIIDNATLYINNYGVYSGGAEDGIDVHYVSNQIWIEETLTWNNQPSYNPSILDTNTVTTAGIWYEWNVTDAVKTDYDAENINSSFMAKAKTEGVYGHHTFRSKEWGDTSLRPYLNITYSEGEPENCWTDTGTYIFIPDGCYYEILNGEVG